MCSYLDSTDILDDGPALAQRMGRDGYLFIRGLLPGEVLEELRLQFLAIARRAGWVRADAPLQEAVADLDGFCVEPEADYMNVYHHMYKIPGFHALQHRPELLGLLERMLGGDILPHARIIGRTIFPQKEAFTTPPHQDFIPIQGTAQTYTAWFPLHAMDEAMGGLQVAAGSHRSGVYDFRPSLGAGGLEVTQDLGDSWVGGSFDQGDVLFFHSMAVHRGIPNTGSQLRMSIDSRFQRADQPVAPGSLEPHSQPHTWEEIYQDWADERFQYYWRQWDLEVVEYDPSYHQKRDDMALEMAAQGNADARSTLQRIIARDADPAKRAKAEELLTALDGGQ
ncbi:MAG: phytanoyl-CoA dioxygenase [Candidatus Latescibacteria bacterium]|nr:phytanoyl-CoA dioxygenase [Candidatus Latescibacterota bacterium]